MGRKFSQEQAHELRWRLILEAGNQFGTHGFKRVTIDDVARSVGIAKGTVYRFFFSKEDLLVACVQMVRTTIQSSLVDAILFDHDRTPDDVMRRLLLETGTLMVSYPVLRCVNEPELYQSMRSELQRQGSSFFEILTLFDVERIMLHWKDQGIVVDIPPRLLEALLLKLTGFCSVVVNTYAQEAGTPGEGAVNDLLLSILDIGISSFIRKDRKRDHSSRG